MFTTEGHPIPVGDWAKKNPQPRGENPQAPNRTRSTARERTEKWRGAATDAGVGAEVDIPVPPASRASPGGALGSSGNGECGGVSEVSGLPNAAGVDVRKVRGEESEWVRLLRRAFGLGGEVLGVRRRGLAADWGLGPGKGDAMGSKVCPNLEFGVKSLCHVLDEFEGHGCSTGWHCGVDARTCNQRQCYASGYCNS